MIPPPPPPRTTVTANTKYRCAECKCVSRCMEAFARFYRAKSNGGVGCNYRLGEVWSPRTKGGVR